MVFRFSFRTWWIDKRSQETRTHFIHSFILFIYLYLYSCVCCLLRLAFFLLCMHQCKSGCACDSCHISFLLLSHGGVLCCLLPFMKKSRVSFITVIVIADGTLRCIWERDRVWVWACVRITSLTSNKTNPFTFCLCSHSSHGFHSCVRLYLAAVFFLLLFSVAA